MNKSLTIKGIKITLLCAVTAFVIAGGTGCRPPEANIAYMGKWDGAGNCVKYGGECAVISLRMLDGQTVYEHVVDLR